jgi:2'-5' RNA ligase
MVALVPSAADAAKMAVDGGEDPDQMHLTLAYLGDQATGMPEDTKSRLHSAMSSIAAVTPPVSARATGHLLFNPDGGPEGDRTPCAAYVVSDSPVLTSLRDAVIGHTDEPQHDPFIPHVTGAYDRDAGALTYAGPVRFHALRVAIGDRATDYPFSGDTSDHNPGKPVEKDAGEPGEGLDNNSGNSPDDGGGESDSVHEEKSMAEDMITISSDELTAAYELKGAPAPTGHAMPDGSYPINHPGQLKTAINALTSGAVSGSKKAKLKRHVITHANRLKAKNMLPADLKDKSPSDIPDDESDDKGKSKNKETKAAPMPAAPAAPPAAPAPPAQPEGQALPSTVARPSGARYGTPEAGSLPPARDAAGQKAREDADAVTAYQDLLAGRAENVEPLPTMTTPHLQALARVAYSYNSTDPKVTTLRIQIASELAKRGLHSTDYGATSAEATQDAGGASDATGSAAPTAKKTAPMAQKSADDQWLEYKAKYSASQRRAMAKKGHALPDGSFPIADRADLKSAINLRNNGQGYSKDTVHKHIKKNAKRIGATDMLPPDLSKTADEQPDEKKSLPELSWDGAPDAFTAGVLLGLSGMDTDEAIELKAGPPGHTFPSPDPNAARLREYWVHGAGAAKVEWGTPGDFDRCVVEMTKFVGTRAKGLCNIYHRSALGVAPGQEDKPGHAIAKAVGKMTGKSVLLPGEELENKALRLWVRDAASVDGWRAYRPAWEADLDLVNSMQNEVKALFGDDEEDEDQQNAGTDTTGDATSTSDDGQPNTDADTPDSTDVLAKLDRYAAMAPQLSTAEGYAEGITNDIPWQLESDGDLVNPDDPEGTAYDDEDDLTGVAEGPGSTVADSGEDLGGQAAEPVVIAEAIGQGDNPGVGSGAETAQDNPADGSDDVTESDSEADNEGSEIPAVADLLAALLDDSGDEDPNDDNDNGEPEDDSEEVTDPRRKTVGAA